MSPTPGTPVLPDPVPITAFDVHSHMIPAFVQDVVRSGTGRFDLIGTDRSLQTRLGPVPTDAAQLHTVRDKCAALDRLGVQRALVSLTPHLFRHGPQSYAVEYARLVNDELAGVAGDSPRLSALATLPLGHPRAAAAELGRAVTDLGLRGAIVGPLLPGGTGLDEGGLDPVFQVAQELGVALFVHSSYDGPISGTDFFLHNTIGVPVDIALGASRLILSGVLDRFPDLRLLLGHGGGSLIPLMGRLDNVWRTRPTVSSGCRRRPSQYLDRIWVDSVVLDPQLLAFIAVRIGADHIVLGTDSPYTTGDPAPLTSVVAAGLDPHELAGNAEILLAAR